MSAQSRVKLAVENFVYQHPRFLGSMLGGLRRVCPVLPLGGVTMITRYAGVEEILSRETDFTIGHYTPKMEAIAGRFILGLQESPQYEHDISVLRLAVPRSDVGRIGVLVEEIVEEIFVAARPRGELDLVGDLTDLVPARLCDRYFGVPGPSEDVLVEWGRTLFHELFYNIRDDPAIGLPAQACSAVVKRYVEGVIDARRAAAPRDDVLGRMLTLEAQGEVGIDELWIRTYLMGMIVGMLPLTSKATALILNVMLDRPRMLASAQAAVADGDEKLLWRYISEAMRIAPQSPGQFRVADGDWTVKGGTWRRHRIASGTKVFAATQSAMFDPRVFEQPREVRIDRPDSIHLHFGYGLHSCFGRFISHEAVPRIVKAVLSQPGLRRAQGRAGSLRWSGPFPESLNVKFDPS